MKSPVNKTIDPRLRKVLARMGDAQELEREVSRGLLTAEAVPAGAPPSYKTRTLVAVATEGDAMKLPQPAARVTGRIYAVDLDMAQIAQLGQTDGVLFVEAPRRLAPVIDTAIVETRVDRVRPSPIAPGFDGRGVVVGIIDYGFDFTLDDFRNADGTTRIAFLWDQELSPEPGEASPNHFNYGVEYDAARIDAALQANDPFARVRHRPNPASHGTHVAGIAAGNGRTTDLNFAAGRYAGVAPNAQLVLVQPSTTDQQSTFTDSVHAAEAIAYVFEKAKALRLPCVINMSLGQNGGSHDGESILERAIDRLLEEPGRAFVCAGGNEHTWREHAAGRLAKDDRRELRWKMGGSIPVAGGHLPPGAGDFTPNEMEIWYSSRDRLRVHVVDPQGNISETVDPGESAAVTFPTGDRVFLSSERFSRLNGEASVYIEVSPSVGGRVTTGEWRVVIEAMDVLAGRFDAWIERDVRRSNNNFADQSFFVGNDFDPAMTLGTPSTSRRGITVANYDHRTEAPNDSSGRGPTRDGRHKPEVSAPGTGILSTCARAGTVKSALERWPARVPMSGTSMSAPHVTGIVALMLQKSPTLTSPQIRGVLTASARPPQGQSGFDVAWGFGRVDAEAALALVRE